MSEPEWKVFTFVHSDRIRQDVIKCTYSDEIGGAYTRFCMAVFESPTEWKLVSPELGPGLMLEKANLVNFLAVTVPVSEKLNYGKLKD